MLLYNLSFMLKSAWQQISSPQTTMVSAAYTQTLDRYLLTLRHATNIYRFTKRPDKGKNCSL